MIEQSQSLQRVNTNTGVIEFMELNKIMENTSSKGRVSSRGRIEPIKNHDTLNYGESQLIPTSDQPLNRTRSKGSMF